MTTHPLSGPLTVEPPTWPANDAPYFDCEVCEFEHDNLNDEGMCPNCAELMPLSKEDLCKIIAEWFEVVDNEADKVRALRREVADLHRLVCPDCKGMQVLQDDNASPCPCDGGVR